MTQADWIIESPNYSSIAALLSDLESFRSRMGFAVHGISDANVAAAKQLLADITHAQKTLKYYLYALANTPASKQIFPADVLKTFEVAISAHDKIPESSETRFIKIHPMHRYSESLRLLLNDPEALQAAREIPIKLGDIIADSIL